uniref:Uncharacterized protein LOC102805922 n=1 Tax=Saccoglossus kowalevskii TaxID=10224 RepID=A0ABM0N008_SACKO|nr:PREDICTED: uncharacterized protein LOC102805922 [Saccoglossus kowalevskii]
MKSSNKPDPTGIADESDKLQDMYTTTEISLVDSGVGYMSDSSSVFKINKRISSDMSSISKPEETVRNAQYVDKASRNTAEVENWQELFERPTAQQRKQFYQQRQKEKQHKMQRVPQIMYHSDKVRLVDNVAGQRILKELSVMDRIGKHPDGEMQWRSIAPIPARLSVHTHGEKTGNTKFGLLNMSWTSGLPKFQHDSRIGNECNIPQLDISRDQGRQRLQDYMLPSSSSFIASNLHRNWQAKRCNLLTSCSSQATHSDYQWESHKTIKISTASADTTLPPRDGKIQNCVTTNVKQQMPPSLNLPKMRPTAIIGTKALNKLNSNSKLPDITASLRFLTSRKDEVPQNA